MFPVEPHRRTCYNIRSYNSVPALHPSQLQEEIMPTSQPLSTRLTLSQTTTVITPDGVSEQEEHLAIETPYSIALNDETIGSSMVLPIGLEEFGAGFLFGQGYIKTPEEIKEIIVCPEGRIAVYADVENTEPKEVIITSGCGGTGKISKEMLEGAFEPLQEYTITLPEIGAFIRQTLQSSPLGPQTHCVHGCGLWQDGRLQVFFEDVGRHNAVDKVLGGHSPAKGQPEIGHLYHRTAHLGYGTEMRPHRHTDHHVANRPLLSRPGHRPAGGGNTHRLRQAGAFECLQCP